MAASSVSFLKDKNTNFNNVIDSFLNLTDGGTVAGASTFSGLIQLDGGHEATVVLSGGGTTTLTSANSGATCIFDTAGASNFTLPSPNLGMRFHFLQAITATSDHVIQAATNDHGFLGGGTFTQLTSTSADQCDSFSAATDGNNDFITLNGSTTGGVAGGYLFCAAILATSAAKTWAVHGSLIGTGNTITPFGDAQI